jgi:hypothetical protein
VDPVPDPLLFSGSAGNRTRATGSVAKKSEGLRSVYSDILKEDAAESYRQTCLSISNKIVKETESETW